MKFGVLVATMAAVAWGYVYATKDTLVQSMSPLGLLSSFYLSGALILLPVALLRREEILHGISSNQTGFLTAIAGILIAEFCIIWSISLLGGAEAALVEVSYPLWTLLALYFFYGKVPSTQTLIGGALIMSGVFLLSTSQKEEGKVPQNQEESHE